MASAARALVRQATSHDLPHIHNLIRSSYAAMNDLTGDPLREMWASGAEKSITSGDLVEKAFLKEYLNGETGANFWVAEVLDLGVVGCVGLKRKSLHDGELVRMSVNEAVRGQNIGKVLVTCLEEHCAKVGIRRIHLVTANTRAASFYAAKCNFSLTHGFSHSVMGVSLTVAKMTKFLSLERPIEHVTIVGGTHGNERIGVALVEAFLRDPAPFQRPSLRAVTALLGNPQAVDMNVRYVEQDLNRQFAQSNTADAATASDMPESIEARRAKELIQLLGPKSVVAQSSTDFIIDLHSTTSNVSLVSMISASDCDPMALYVASKVGSKMDPESYRITTTEGDKAGSWSVDSVSTSGISFEVGPLSHGILQYHLFDQTYKLVMAALDVIEERNQRLAAGNVEVAPSQFPLQKVFTQVATVEYPESGFCIHPDLDVENFRLIKHGDPAFISADGKGTILSFVHPNAPKEGSPSTTSPPAPITALYTLFVNEASYRERNIAFALYEEKQKPVLFV